MKNLERIFAVLQGKKFDRLPFVATITWWYNEHRARGTLPEKYKNTDALGVAKDVGFTLLDGTGFYRIRRENIETVVRSELVYDGSALVKKGLTAVVEKTPVGKLESVRVSTGLSNLPKEFPVKTVEDMKTMKYILDHSRVEPTFEEYVSMQKYYGDDGLVLPIIPHSPVNSILYDIMGQQRGIVALYRYQKEVEDLMMSIEGLQDEIYRLAEKLPSKIIHFGEHVHSVINDPRIFKKYQIPYFKKRIAQLHAKGKICSCHWDGHFKDLLPLIKDTGFDAIHGVTPKPSGDVTLTELIDAVEGKTVLWGGIPAPIFQEPFTDQHFEEYVMNILKTIAPGDRFIMDIGDNLGPTGYIHRLRTVKDILEKHGYYPIRVN